MTASRTPTRAELAAQASAGREAARSGKAIWENPNPSPPLGEERGTLWNAWHLAYGAECRAARDWFKERAAAGRAILALADAT